MNWPSYLSLVVAAFAAALFTLVLVKLPKLPHEPVTLTKRLYIYDWEVVALRSFTNYEDILRRDPSFARAVELRRWYDWEASATVFEWTYTSPGTSRHSWEGS